MTTATPANTAKPILSFEGFFLGLSASERFFRHLPDFVLSRSFDHLPFSTRGAGKNPPQPLSFLDVSSIYI
jgi:hypothetical protein